MVTMFLTYFCGLLISLLGQHVQSSASSLQLQSVFVLLRHGDRTPTHFYTNDPFQDVNQFWPEGLGQLNDHGKSRIRAAGRFYQVIYEQFLKETHGWPNSIWSSPRNRAIETGMFFMESFLQGTQISFQIYQDGKMLSTSAKCPLSDQLWLNHITNSTEIKEYIESKRAFIRYLEKKTGDYYLEDRLYTLRNLEFLATTLEIERDEYHLPVPEWAKNRSTIEQLDDLKQHAFWFDWQLIKIQRLRIGLLLNNVLHHIHSFISGSNLEQRFFLYSAHDVNQVLLLQALGLYDKIGRRSPSYCSGIVLEHYQHQESRSNFIRIVYRQILSENQTSNSEFIRTDQTLTMDTCDYQTHTLPDGQLDRLCPLDQFEIATKSLNIKNDDWDQDCDIHNNSDPIYYHLMLVLILIFAAYLNHN